MAKRIPEYAVHDLIVGRWSPRAMTPDDIEHDKLMSLFEAARWAPSSYNNQPWRFVYAKRGTPAFDAFLNLLVDFNKQWAQHAGALVVVISKNDFEKIEKPSRTHAFDTGAAWQNIALQGHALGLVVHGMEGFSYANAKELLQIPEGYTVQAMFAVGKPGKKENLPEELQEREEKSDRKKVKEFVFEELFAEKDG